MSMGDFETTLESSTRESSILPIGMTDRHVTINPSQRHQHQHHHHHHHHSHHQHQHSSSHVNQSNDSRRHPVTLHLNSNNGSYPSELATLLRHIVEHSGSRRADVLRDLRRLLKKSGGQLPDVDRMQFFEAFYPMLIDSRWKVVCECTMLIVDIIPQMGEHDLDPCMAIILPRIVPNLGHEATDVRRASLRLLHVYMRYTNNLQKVLRLYIQYGLESHDKSAQKGCVLSLPLLFTEEFSKENLFPLVQSLGHLLVHSDASLFYPIFLAMQRLHSLVGNETFRLYLQHLSQETVSLYQKVLSRASTADSGGRHETDPIKSDLINTVDGNAIGETIKKDLNESMKVNTDQSNESFIPMEKLIVTSSTNDLPKSSFEESVEDENETGMGQEMDLQCENINESRSRLMTGDSISEVTSDSSYSKMGFANEYVLIYGIFPVAVHNRATSTKMNEKLEGLNQMIAIIKEAPDSHVSALIPYLPRFLDSFITTIVNNPNFKVTLIGLEMIELIVARLGVSAYPCLETIIDILLKRLGDGRSVVREHDIKVIHRLMLHWPPQNVLDMLLRHKFNRNPKVREEIINRVTFALLMFPRTEFNLHRITYEISTMLIDPKRQVRLSALESIAVIAQALGPSRLDSLLATVSAIEQTSESEGLVNAVQARLSRRDLPRCNPDGSLRYVLNVSNFSGWFPSTSEADIEWVLLASSTSPHIGTPPKLHHHYLGRFNEQYRRYTMKQAEAEGFHFKNPNLTETEPESDKITSKSAEPNQIFQVDDGHENHHRPLANCISSEDEKSEQSDESTKSRDLWRYYFMRFKQHLAVATCSSASSAISSRSKTADWTKKLDHELDKSSRRSSFSQLTDYNSHQHQTHHSSYQNLHTHPHLITNPGLGHHHLPTGSTEIDCIHGGAGDEIESQMSQSYDESLNNENIGLLVHHRDNRAFSMPSIATSGLTESQPESSHLDDNQHHHQHNPHHLQQQHHRHNQHLDQPENEIFYQNNRKKSVQISSYPRSVPTSPEKRNSFQTESDFDINFERPRSAVKSSPPCPIHPDDVDHDENDENDEPVNRQKLSSLNIPKVQGSSANIPTDKNSQRSSNEQSKDNQESNISKTNQRSSILPSVSVDEPTESEDNQSEDKNYEGNKQTMIKQSLPTDQGKSDVNVNVNCGTNESDPTANQGQSESDKQTESNQIGDKVNDTTGGGGGGGEMIKSVNENGDNCDNSSSVSGSTKGEEDQVDDQDKVKQNDNDHVEGVEGDEDDEDDDQQTVEDEDGQQNETTEKSNQMKPKSRTPGMKRKSILVGGRKRLSRSSSPVHRQPQYHMIRIQPAIPPNANIRHIMENVVKTEGPFDNPQEALRAALAAFGEEGWTTKVEGMLAVTRLASFHPSVLLKDFHSIIVSLVDEVKNLRSSVSRSAIFTLGDLFVKMKKPIESEIDLIGSALLAKCSENASFIREDCEKALASMVEEMPQIKSALVLVHWGANHRNMNVRRVAAYFLSTLVEKMGPVKCLMGPKDIGEHLLQSSSKFLMDGSPHTRFYGRKIFAVLLNHNQFDKLLRKHVTPGTYRNIFLIVRRKKKKFHSSMSEIFDKNGSIGPIGTLAVREPRV